MQNRNLYISPPIVSPPRTSFYWSRVQSRSSAKRGNSTNEHTHHNSQSHRDIHRFLDLSNILINKKKNLDGSEDPSFRLNLKNLDDLTGPAKKSYCFGSVPENNRNELSLVHSCYNKINGWDVRISIRPEGVGEQDVDTTLVAQIQKLL